MSKLWKLLKWIGIILMMAFSVLLITIAVLNWQANSQLDKHLSAIRAADEPITLADLQGESVPPAENAITHLLLVEKEVQAITSDLGTVLNDGPYRDSGRLNEEGATLVRSAFQTYADVVPQLERAIACSHYVPTHDFTAQHPVVLNSVMQAVGHSRSVARVLMLRADLLMYDGQLDEAMKTCLLALQFARHLEREPFAVGFLISLAVREGTLQKINDILIDGPISDENCSRLEAELARDDGSQGFEWCIQTERVYGLASFRGMQISKLPLWYVKNREADYLELMALELELGSSPKYLIASGLSGQQTRVASSNETLVQMFYPALPAIREALDRTRAFGRCLYVLSAFQRQAVDAQGDTFDVDDLGLDENLTIDPYTGKPLMIKNTGQGWIVYAVGGDGKDDGGKIDGQDVGVGPAVK
jgi:hypothetical protein